MKETILWEIERGERLTAAEIAWAETKRTELYHRMRRFMERYDFFVLPTAQVPPFSVDQPYVTEIDGVAMETYIDWMKSCYYISIVGNPGDLGAVRLHAGGTAGRLADRRPSSRRLGPAADGPRVRRCSGMTTTISTALACANCGASLGGAYCQACGQKAVSPDVSLHDFAHEAIHEFGHVDGKVVRTLRMLVAKPGMLTREFLEGRRTRYISPLRVYLSCSALFFALAALAPDPRLSFFHVTYRLRQATRRSMRRPCSGTKRRRPHRRAAPSSTISRAPCSR